MITEQEAEKFAHEWIASWNAHDLDRIMAHYDEEVEYYSLFATQLTDHATGCIKGKSNVREYLSKGLAAYPDLKFKPINVFIGVLGIVLHYESVNDLIAAEAFELNSQRLAVRVQ